MSMMRCMRGGRNLRRRLVRFRVTVSRCQFKWLALILSEDFAVLHDECRVLKDLDVGERIAGNGDDVGEEAGLELADGVGPVEEFCAVDEIGAEDVGWGHAVLDHELELAGLGAVGERAHIRTKCEGSSGG